MTEPVIRFHDVSKAFRAPGRQRRVSSPSTACRSTIAKGEIVAVLGKTGCGKSTMFNLLAGLIEPTSGKVAVDRPRSVPRLRVLPRQDRHRVPERPADAVAHRARQRAARAAKSSTPSASEAEAIARGWLDRLGLAGHENDYPHALSGGMRQRVSIARAFAVEPDILLCDEPFSSLDEMTARDLRAEFVRLVRQNDKTAVFITHHINEAMEIGDRILVFHRPARIAFEARMDEAARKGGRQGIHQQIMDVLGRDATVG